MFLGFVCLMLLMSVAVALSIGVLALADAIFRPLGDSRLATAWASENDPPRPADSQTPPRNRPAPIIRPDESTIIPSIAVPPSRDPRSADAKQLGL